MIITLISYTKKYGTIYTKIMNRQQYLSDARYAKVLEQMDLLGIMDITTTRQDKNGTIVWKLPIKDQDSGILIEVASFASGYVRNQGKSCRSNFQLNKRYFVDEYYKDYDWVDGKQKWNGKYRRFKSKSCTLIPIEIDRLEYLISYCLKNYYIKNANRIADGDYIPKWRYDNALHKLNCGKVRDLENKLDTIKRIADYGQAE